MGNDAAWESANQRATKWNAMLDGLAAHKAGDLTAEEVVDLVTAYVVSIHNIRITLPKEYT